jgi:hypothetical protein
MDHLHSSGSRSAEKVTPASENAAREAREILRQIKTLRAPNAHIAMPKKWRGIVSCALEKAIAEASAVIDDRSAANATEVAR